MSELPKPPELAARGGCWFASASGAEVHVGVEEPFAPARKAHPGLTVIGLDDLAATLGEHGIDARWSQEIPGVRRFHADDPFGNRIEFIDATATGHGSVS